MSEHLPSLDEKELVPSSGEKLLPAGEHNAGETSEHVEGRDRQDRENSARRYVEQHAVSGEKAAFEPEKLEAKIEPQPQLIHKELKDQAYARLLKRARKQLRTSDRALSRIVHQPLIDRLSDLTSSTVARPSGILGGSVLSLIGAGGLLIVSRRYGFSYNFLAFVIFFAGGFLLGLLTELMLHFFTKRKAAD